MQLSSSKGNEVSILIRIIVVWMSIAMSILGAYVLFTATCDWYTKYGFWPATAFFSIATPLITMMLLLMWEFGSELK